MEKQFGIDRTVGSVPRHLLSYTIPMFSGNLIQIGYSLVNTVWVGHLVGENGVGAVGVSLPIFFILVGFSMGITMATTILVSQYYGAKDYRMVEKAVHTSFSLSLILGLALTIAGIFSSDTVLRWMGTPPENFTLASGYLKISLVGFILLYLGLLINSILRGIGDTLTPLAFMATGIGLNILLDPFLIGGFGPFPKLELNGAAYASVISQAVAFIISIVYLNRKSHLIAFHPKRLLLDGRMSLMIFKIGLPSIVQQMLVWIGALFITTFVNFFGNTATNAFGAVARVDMFAVMPALSMGVAVSALTGQNLGAGKPGRVKEIFKWGVIMISSITILISVIAVFFSELILKMFGLGNDLAVMRIGVNYLRIVGSCYTFFAILFISNGVINGAGHTIITMIFSLLSLWFIRVPGSWFLSRKTSLGITGIWISVAFSFLFVMVISLAYYYSGRWKKHVIIKAPPTVSVIE